MKRIALVAMCLVIFTSTAFAQQLKFPPGLDARASEVVDVTMDRNMLTFASKFLSSNQRDQETKRVISKLNGIYVKSYSFSKPGEHKSDVQLFRAQLKAPLWFRVMEARDHNESVEVYFRDGNGVVSGMAIIAADEEELTLVHIDGPLSPEDFDVLGGQFGIPRIHGIPGVPHPPRIPSPRGPNPPRIP